MEAIALNLGAPVQAIREKNFYQPNQLTPYLQPVLSLSLPRVWQTLITSSNYQARRAAAASYNAANKWRKRAYVTLSFSRTLPFPLESFSNIGL
jgi:xanthine dehydrogenase large subunit